MFVFPFTFVPKLLGIFFIFFSSDMGCRVEFCCSWPLVLIMAINQNHLGEKKEKQVPAPYSLSFSPPHTPLRFHYSTVIEWMGIVYLYV